MKRARRKALSLVLALVMCLGLALPASAAYEVSRGGYTYELSNDPVGTVEINGNRGQMTIYVVPDNTVITCKTAPNAFLSAAMFASDEDDDGNPYYTSEGEWGEEGFFEVIPYGPQFAGPAPVFFEIMSGDQALQNLIETGQVSVNDASFYVVAQSAAVDMGWTAQSSPSTPSTPTTPSTSTPYVVLSPQKLTVDGKDINCEKYNIDGANYFKLRDLAYLLNGTGSQFSVGFDAATATVSVTTGMAYTPNNTELVTGIDNSSTAQPSSQTIIINGVERSDLTVYNIGGSNFFQLRELGTALGFTVDFDADTNTAIVSST